MKLNQLRYFVAVCSYPTVTRAAEHLHVSQPSITAAIHELESEFNMDLFYRGNRKLALTPAGELFYERACRILKEVETLEEDMADLTENRNHIKLGLPPQIGAFFLPALLRDFQDTHPGIRLEVIECGAKESVKMLMEESIDMSIASTARDNPNLNYSHLFDTEICFCVEAEHELAHEPSIRLESACSMPCVMLQRGFFTPDSVLERCSQLHLTPDVRLYSQQLHTIKNLIIHAGFGSFLLREAVALDDNISSIPLDPPITASVDLITKKGRHMYHDSKLLISFIIERYRMQQNHA